MVSKQRKSKTHVYILHVSLQENSTVNRTKLRTALTFATTQEGVIVCTDRLATQEHDVGGSSAHDLAGGRGRPAAKHPLVGSVISGSCPAVAAKSHQNQEV
jgi:hypothetical protein